MKNALKIFNDYVKKYDLTDKEIMKKYHHSLRVMEIANKIATSLNLSEEEIELSTICGLFHDIARFYQWTKYHTFKDFSSIDHGDYGVVVLQENHLIEKLTKEKSKQEIILNSVKYHNKIEVPPMDNKLVLFINIIRDADKLDILKTQGIKMDDEKIILKEDLIASIFKKQVCSNQLIQTDTDKILKHLSWIFDLNFTYSYLYLKKNNIITNKFHLLELYGENKEINHLKNFIQENIYEKEKNLEVLEKRKVIIC